MSTSVPPRDGGALSGSVNSLTPFLADESALRRIFDAEYSALVLSAKSQLGDAASQAPRVVESAFISAWAHRPTLHDAEQVRAFLASDVHHGASRALSRRAAAHRFGTHGGRDTGNTGSHAAASDEANAERSWEQITHAINTEGGSENDQAHLAAAEVGRHEAAAHMKSVGKGQSWVVPVLIGVAALAISVVAVIYTSRLGEDDAMVSATSNASIQPIASSPGQIGTLTLRDGTKMRIGPDTKVFIPDEFPTKIRAIKVDGTAEFDVAKGQPIPFRVVANRTHLIATGTNFVVYAYSGDSSVLVQVRDGSVTVKSGKQSSTVTANQMLFIDRTTMRAPTDDERAQAFGWPEGRIAVEHKQLRAVVAQLARWFNLDIKVPDLKLLDREAGFNVSLDSSRAAIAQVEKSGNVKFTYEGDSKVFRDAMAKK
ncbi:MAG: FecR protein [Gemmatimonadetes bacterium]|nr:FecR protein [Gemmatimonadota bacterium]